jgi:hypothetical protein
MIDAILRAAEVMMMAEHGPHEKPTLNFYADDGESVVKAHFSLITTKSWNTLRSGGPLR